MVKKTITQFKSGITREDTSGVIGRQIIECINQISILDTSWKVYVDFINNSFF